MQKLQDIYINFIISSFEKIEMTKLSKLTGKSHDVFTKSLLLDNTLDDDKKLWKSIKPFLRDYENEESGCIIPNYAIEIKNYTLSLQSSGIH